MSNVLVPLTALHMGILQVSKSEFARTIDTDRKTLNNAWEGDSRAAQMTVVRKILCHLGVELNTKRDLLDFGRRHKRLQIDFYAIGDWLALLEGSGLPYALNVTETLRPLGRRLVTAHFSRLFLPSRVRRAHSALLALTPGLANEADLLALKRAKTKLDFSRVGKRLAIRRTAALLLLAEMELAVKWPEGFRQGLFFDRISSCPNADLWRSLIEYWDGHHENRAAHIAAIEHALRNEAQETVVDNETPEPDVARELRHIAEAVRAPSTEKLQRLPQALLPDTPITDLGDPLPPPYVALMLQLGMIGLREFLAWVTEEDPADAVDLANLFAKTRHVLRFTHEKIPAWYDQAGIGKART